MQQSKDRFPLLDNRLYDLQKSAQVAWRESFRKGHKRICSEIPTGVGKTVTFTLFPKEGARVLVMVPSIDLVGQTAASIARFRDVQPETEWQQERWEPGGCNWCVASLHTLLSNDRYERMLGQFDLIIWDECHDCATERAAKMLDRFVVSGARVLGVSATCYRGNKKSLLGFFDDIAYAVSLKEAISDGYLVPLKCKTLQLKTIDTTCTRMSGGDFSPKELSRLMRDEVALHEMCNLYKERHVPGKPAMMFVASIAQAKDMIKILKDRYGIQASTVYTGMEKDDLNRWDEIRQFTDGDRELMITVGCLVQGWDHPPVSEVYICRVCGSLGRLTQMIGRCTRVLKGTIDASMSKDERLAAIASSDKPFARVYDMTDSTRNQKIRTCVDLLMEGHTQATIDAVKKKAEEEDIEDIDAAVEEEMRRAREEARMEEAERRRQRMGSVVGVTFEARDCDLFGDAEPKSRREWRFPFGKHTGKPLRLIEKGYLEWALREANLKPFWKQAIAEHLDRRYQQEKVRA